MKLTFKDLDNEKQFIGLNYTKFEKLLDRSGLGFVTAQSDFTKPGKFIVQMNNDNGDSLYIEAEWIGKYNLPFTGKPGKILNFESWFSKKTRDKYGIV